MADTEKPVDETPVGESPSTTNATTATPVAERKQRKDRQTGKKVVAGANAVRSRIASIVWLVAVVCALFLAVGALLIALNANQDNAVVQFVLNGADKLDLGRLQPGQRDLQPEARPARNQERPDQLGSRRHRLPHRRQGAGPHHPPLSGRPSRVSPCD